ncbi:hypothetical protein C4K03_1287 [Pseudomonas synxantha]|uniref:Uncharacterized protein n=1 Tax=Pseudomonas synxantha TaxID=47883 RepID=A0A3G7U449_9PSED|nr:hypothetical protein [Pseudomonas synxantha]AZE53458.1 hypothetical protein C4K03_1287 [Pseudomonas synxantha]
MSNQFKPGDLALVIGGDHLPLNTGRQCTLITLAVSGAVLNNPNNDARYVYVGDYTCWLVAGPAIENDSPDLEDAGLDLIEERYLMLLRGDFATAPERAQELPA